jgi:FtsP/CotA-like multicopper oxidase with cupredoxin domain
VRRGQRVRIHLINNLPEQTIIHWHGLHVSEEMDAHPRYVVPAGETYTYEFTVTERAGTYWFHPHTHELTATQVYKGLVGFFIVSDDEEAALGLPSGAYDLPLIIQDRTFDADHQLVYRGSGMMSGMMLEMMGFLGDFILVNGQPLPWIIETRAYRLRLLNGSNSRIYKLAWSDGTPLTVIATDGGLLETPVQRDYVMLSPGERLELWADFSRYTVGDELQLMSLAFTGVEAGGMMMEMEPDTNLPHGSEFPVLTFNIARASQERLTLPERLSTIQRYAITDAINADAPRTFDIALQSTMVWTINGRGFEMESAAEDEIVHLNTTEVWEFYNVVNSGMSMPGMDMGSETADQMAHPMHIHGARFLVIERTVDEDFRAGWESVSAGYVDEGWKDTVLLMPGERVKLLLRFEDYTGLFVFHCHNLEHGDNGLMRNYQVVE